MKKMMVALVALFAFGTALASPNMSWDEIHRDSGLHASFPLIGFGGVAVSVDKLCVDGESLRPFSPYYERCSVWDNNWENPSCVETETVYLSTPIRYTVTECAEWDNNWENPSCARYVRVEKQHRLTYNIDVYNAHDFGSEGGAMNPLFTKPYTIAACN